MEAAEQKSKIILEKAAEKRTNEDESETKERLVKTLQPRDEAMKKIFAYQDN